MKSASLFLFAFLPLLVACGGLPAGTHVQVRNASRAELEAASASRGIVYYEFEEGDRVPLVFGVRGVLEASSETATMMVARRAFSLVVHPNGDMSFIFDGEHLTPAQFAARWTMLVGAGPTGASTAGIVLGIGQDRDFD